ncbi:T9SS type A sorting domain-containing protein [Flammeovirgaceae bacterium SG7u.111]|nr:T9SS type A sorting domain-containing protein [Flammeovirgaceae bacterium SG7u.132]WPO35955.1 T9SS type A sorting domain-containing protein [Flammeovirgaceae bacterium SG7u.111]
MKFQLLKSSLILCITMLVWGQVSAQFNYVSQDNTPVSINWADASTWNIPNDSNPYDPAPVNPGNPTTHNRLGTVDIYGYVLVSGDLTINNANPVINVHDTLVINGDATLGSGAALNVSGNGILIILGKLTVLGSFDLGNNGRMVVTEDLEVKNGTVQNDNDLYVYGSTSAASGGGGTVNGCDAYNTAVCDPEDASKTESELQSDDLPLYNFVNEISGGGIIPLPVELESFSGKFEEDRVQLSFSTISEYDSDKFLIERSLDGRTFETIGEVNSEGYSNTRIVYSFQDTSPNLGVNYYRLTQVDFDGSTELSKVITVVAAASGIDFNIYPNPVSSNYFTVEGMGVAPNSIIPYVIYSSEGVVVLTGELTSESSFSKHRIDIPSQLGSGLYILKLFVEGEGFTKSFLKQ